MINIYLPTFIIYCACDWIRFDKLLLVNPILCLNRLWWIQTNNFLYQCVLMLFFFFNTMARVRECSFHYASFRPDEMVQYAVVMSHTNIFQITYTITQLDVFQRRHTLPSILHCQNASMCVILLMLMKYYLRNSLSLRTQICDVIAVLRTSTKWWGKSVLSWWVHSNKVTNLSMIDSHTERRP